MRTSLSLALFVLLFSSLAWADASEENLNTLLDSGSLSAQRAAFDRIASLPEQHVPLVKDRFAAILKGKLKPTNRSLDRLFYLAAFLKDKSLAAPMAALWKDTSFFPDYCLYSCPINFALTFSLKVK
jgi:hypothetical protein